MGTVMDTHEYLSSERAYFHFVKCQYEPNVFECIEEDTRFVPESHNAWVNGQRFRRMLQMLNRHYAQTGEPKRAVDIGIYPGTWIQLARNFWSDITWQGVGLCMSSEFQAWAEKEKLDLFEVDMDPFYAKEDIPSQLPFENHSLDLVVASEIFEHLISPLLFLEETSRVLNPGGLMMLTTPNVSHIGAIVRLLKGGSNYERLERSPMFLVKDEWRGHIRFYSKKEMIWLADRYDFDLIDHHYYHDDYPMDVLRRRGLKPLTMRGIRRLFGIIPWYRGGHIMMLRKR